MDTPLNIGNLPNNFCPATLQAMLIGFGGALSVTLPSGSGATLSIGSSKPSSNSDVWFQTDALGRFQRIYLYGQGTWLSAHPMLPGFTVWWFSALPNFATFDGGDANAPGSQSGPMWQQAKDSNGNLIEAQFVMTPGTLPSGKVVAIGNVGGEENHILATGEGAQDPNHNHMVGRFKGPSGTAGTYGEFFYSASSSVSSGSAQLIQGGGSFTQDDISTLTGNFIKTGIVDPPEPSVAGHNTLPVYVTGYLLQRTARLFYAVN